MTPSPATGKSALPAWGNGSRWHRWDPHLHAPGTLRNNQFGSDWDGYFRRIEESQPSPVALGITDYFTLRAYKEVVRRRGAGSLGSIAVIFPNVELRLTIETEARQGINIHLLVCPDEADHVGRVEEQLARLGFTYRNERFPCTDDGLRRLGRAHRDGVPLDDETALREGANQFKVELSALRNLFESDDWSRRNLLVAVAAGNDGLSGIAKDASFRAQREELGRFASVVFSGNPGDRTYWIGQHPDFESNGQTPKPCLHGSDAHALEDVLTPKKGRLCWIRSEPTFDGLRQTLVEPERRVHIGDAPPAGARAGDVLRAVRFNRAPWIDNSGEELLLNDGLVTIIGTKGSGKTAFAELVARAADAGDDVPGQASFIGKAGALLNGLEVELEWGDGTKQPMTFPASLTGNEPTEPRVRYLSQQFVERLCALEGLAAPLIDEIERVVLSAIPEEDRLECTTFAELRRVILEGPHAERDAARNEIRECTRLASNEADLHSKLPALKNALVEAERVRKALEVELAKLPVDVPDAKVNAHQAALARLQTLTAAIGKAERRALGLRAIAADIRRQLRDAQAAMRGLQSRYPALLPDSVWNDLIPVTAPGPLATLTKLASDADSLVIQLREKGVVAASIGQTSDPPSEAEGLTALTAHEQKLLNELGLDQANAKKRIEIAKQLAATRITEEKSRASTTHAGGAASRRAAVQADRLVQYERVFETVVAEERALQQLYAPLCARISADPKLRKLTFHVQRMVDLDAWTKRGESLLDLRRNPFGHAGGLASAAKATLLAKWQGSTPAEVSAAMGVFISQHADTAVKSLAQGCDTGDLGEWMFSTDHISVRYGIQYEGVEISNLSPGTRGVVMLTLFLALDEWDFRPLIIDQPEENLDPRSVFVDLVPFFRTAAKRRQIIMVTHNANLVVNTDSDQVIVAEAHRTSATQLPQVRYIAGGLDDARIRDHVCDLLEGGAAAFEKRGQRYGSKP